MKPQKTVTTKTAVRVKLITQNIWFSRSEMTSGSEQMEKLFETWYRSVRQRLRLMGRAGECATFVFGALKSHLLTCHLITLSPPCFVWNLIVKATSLLLCLSRTAHTRSAPPWAWGNLVSCFKSGGSSWEGCAKYVQQTVEPAGQWAVLSLFTNHCQTPVPGLLLPLTSHTLHTLTLDSWMALTVTVKHV